MAPIFPAWLHIFAISSLVLALLCTVVIIIDEIGRPQKMWIMNLVWPLCALFGSVLWLGFYLRWERGMPRGHTKIGGHAGHPMTMLPKPFPVATATSASHCGAGCTLGDIIAEWWAFAVPAIAVAFGWKSLFYEKIFAVWVLDFILAFLFGIAFQYFTITPMRHLSPGKGLIEALKADTATITAWQIGMYGFMAFAQFVWFRQLFGGSAEVNTPEFWFLMQLAMLCGFATSYPVNWILLKIGVKEVM